MTTTEQGPKTMPVELLSSVMSNIEEIEALNAREREAIAEHLELEMRRPVTHWKGGL